MNDLTNHELLEEVIFAVNQRIANLSKLIINSRKQVSEGQITQATQTRFEQEKERQIERLRVSLPLIYLREEPLKPCPFCGGEAELTESPWSETETRYEIHCIGCACTFGYTGDAATRQHVITAWNTRHQPESK